MGHIRYNGMSFDLHDKFEEVKAQTLEALKADGLATFSIEDRDGDTSMLFISRGTPVSFHSWDAPRLGFGS